MATTKCQYISFCNEITPFLDGPDILTKISLNERVGVENLNLRYPFVGREVRVLCFIIIFFQCVLSLSQ